MRARCFASRLSGRLRHKSRLASVPHCSICPVHSAADSVAPLAADAPPRQASAHARASDGIGRAQLRNAALPRSHCDQPTVPPLDTAPSFAALRVPLAETEAAAVGAGEVLRAVREGEEFAPTDPFEMVAGHITPLSDAIRSLLGSSHPVLSAAAEYFVDGDAERKVRPAALLLMASAARHHEAVATRGACSETAEEFLDLGSHITSHQAQLAEITEMVHTASMLHSGVSDSVGVGVSRRSQRLGAQLGSLQGLIGNKLAVLAGDFLLARASASLARLHEAQVVELIATAIEHITVGETNEVLLSRPCASSSSARAAGDSSDAVDTHRTVNAHNSVEGQLAEYMRSSYFKTASLIANGCRASLVLGGQSLPLQRRAWEFGVLFGHALQLTDDALDFCSLASACQRRSADESHVRALLSTAPLVVARAEHKELALMADRNFDGPGDVERTVQLVKGCGAVERTRRLAIAHAEAAIGVLQGLTRSPARDALAQLTCHVVTRTVSE